MFQGTRRFVKMREVWQHENSIILREKRDGKIKGFRKTEFDMNWTCQNETFDYTISKESHLEY